MCCVFGRKLADQVQGFVGELLVGQEERTDDPIVAQVCSVIYCIVCSNLVVCVFVRTCLCACVHIWTCFLMCASVSH